MSRNGNRLVHVAKEIGRLLFSDDGNIAVYIQDIVSFLRHDYKYKI